MSAQHHCPYRQSTLLQQALAPDKMRIAFMLGAGCPVSIRVPGEGGADKALIPDIKGLTALVKSKMEHDEGQKESYAALLRRFEGSGSEPTIEDLLSHLRSLQEVVRNSSIDGLNKDALISLDAAICSLTTQVVDVALPQVTTPYHRLATWIGGVARANPVEIFTPNYDLLIEQALEIHKIPYFDGFIGARQAFFDLTAMESEVLPTRWVRLWKLHGSINWWRTPADEVVRKEAKEEGDRQMIYPSHLKYDQSRRMPYLAMLDRLRDFLRRGQAILVTCGYSFADQHLNEILLSGLRSNPTAMCFGLLYEPRANYKDALAKAQMHPNLSLLASDGAVLGTINRDWHADVQTGHPLHEISVKGPSDGADGPRNCQFLLGDFKRLGMFLAQQLSRSADDAGEAHAA
jgi:hypothetical protein